MYLRLPKSLAAIFGSFTLGLYVAIQGPTLMDLIDLLHVNNDIMSYSLSFASLAYSVGGLLSGFLFNYVNRQVLISFYYLIFGLSNIITPFLSSYLVFSVITVFKMICAGGTDCATNVWILELWPGKDAWLQALHFSFAVGCALGPLIVEPFLSVDYNKDNGEMDKINGKTSGHAKLDETSNNETRIYIPYAVSGTASLMASIFVMYLYIREQRHCKKTAKLKAKQLAAGGENILLTAVQHPAAIEAGQTSTNSASNVAPPPPEQQQLMVANLAPPPSSVLASQPHTPAAPVKITSKAKEQLVGRPPYYVMFAIALAAMCLSFYCGIEITSMNYLATFAVNIDLQLPKSTAALMSSALTISFAVGRGFGIWIAAYMRPHRLFYLCAMVMATGNILMLIFANTAEKLLWYSICLFGIGCGPMFPAIVSFYDDRVAKVTNTVSGIFILGSMFNVALNSLIIGHHIIDNALILIVCNLIGSVLLLLLFGTLHMLTKVKKHQRVKKFRLQQQGIATTGGAAAQLLKPQPAVLANTQPMPTLAEESQSDPQQPPQQQQVANQQQH